MRKEKLTHRILSELSIELSRSREDLTFLWIFHQTYPSKVPEGSVIFNAKHANDLSYTNILYLDKYNKFIFSVKRLFDDVKEKLEYAFYDDISDDYLKNFQKFIREYSSKLKTKVSQEIVKTYYTADIDIIPYVFFNSISCNNWVPFAMMRWDQNSFVYKSSTDPQPDIKAKIPSWTSSRISKNGVIMKLREYNNTFISVKLLEGIGGHSKIIFSTGVDIEDITMKLADITKRTITRSPETTQITDVEFSGISIPMPVFAYIVTNDQILSKVFSFDERYNTVLTERIPQVSMYLSSKDESLASFKIIRDVETNISGVPKYFTVRFSRSNKANLKENIRFLGHALEYMKTRVKGIIKIYSILVPKNEVYRPFIGSQTQAKRQLKSLREALPGVINYDKYTTDCEKRRQPRIITKDEAKTVIKKYGNAGVYKYPKTDVLLACDHNPLIPIPS